MQDGSGSAGGEALEAAGFEVVLVTGTQPVRLAPIACGPPCRWWGGGVYSIRTAGRGCAWCCRAVRLGIGI